MGLLDDAIREHLDLKRRRGADPGEIERLEREALGPVRRERNLRDIDSVPHLEVQPEHGLEPPHVEEHPTELHHDPTLHAEPHFEPMSESRSEPAAQPEPPAPEPKRGFLRRSRPVSLADAGPTDFTQHLDAELHEDFHTEEHATHGFEEASAPAAPANDPPQLTFDAPLPPRPDFSAEPPGLAPPAAQEAEPEQHPGAAASSPPLPAAEPPAPEPPAPAPAPAPTPAVQVGRDEDEPGATREWDVEDAFAAEDAGHPRHQPDPEPAEEDVLEETPEFLQDTPDHDRLWFEQRPPRDFDFDG